MTDDGIIKLAREQAELYYRHDIGLDLTAFTAEITYRVPLMSPPPQTRAGQAVLALRYAWREVSWDWARVRDVRAMGIVLGVWAATMLIILIT